MSKKITTKDFIDRARTVHGTKYGYAFSVYHSSKNKVFIHCLGKVRTSIPRTKNENFSHLISMGYQ